MKGISRMDNGKNVGVRFTRLPTPKRSDGGQVEPAKDHRKKNHVEKEKKASK